MAKIKMIHDYSKPAEVSKFLYKVNWLLSTGNPRNVLEAREVLASARQVLDEYLSSDNLIPEDDE